MPNTPFHWEITADDAQFRSTMMEAAQEMQNTAGKMQADLTAAFGKIQTVIVGVGAILAGGGMFGEAVNKTAALTKEAQSLGRALGISASEASVLVAALSDIDQSSDAMLTANRAMTRALRENEEGFQHLGVATRDQNGNYRNALDIILDVNNHLKTFKEGTDRNVEGQKIYKKSWEEIEPVLRLTGEQMEESKKRAEALGLVVGKEGVEDTLQYRIAMNNVADVMKAVSKVIGEAVMPILTDLGNWFASTGPERVEIMRQAMAIIVTAFYGLKMAVEIVWGTVVAGVQQMTVYLLTIAEVAERALQFDFTGAKEAWNRGMEQVAAIGDKWMDKIVQDAEVNRDKMFAALFKGGIGTEAPGQTPVARSSGGNAGDAKDKDSMGKWQAELDAQRNAYEQMKIQQGSFEQFSRSSEAAFWQEKLAQTDAGSTLRAEVEKKYYSVLRDTRKQAFEAEIADLRARMEDAKKNATDRIDLANQIYMKEKERYGATSAEASRALAEMQKVTKEYFLEIHALQSLQTEREKQYQLSRVELERTNLDTMEQLGQITAAQKLDRLRQLKEIEYQIEVKAEQDKASVYEEGTREYEEYLNRLAMLRNQHELQMKQIDAKIKVEQVRVWREIGDAITNSFSTAIRGVIMGTQTLTQAMRNMAQNVLLALIDMGVKWLAQQAVNAIIGQTIEKTAAVSTITANAAVAASGAASSVASIPFVGWIMAPAVAAETFAATEAWAGAVAAAGGFDIPPGLNPLTQLHEKEMVLPAHIAEPLRDTLANGGLGGGGDVHLHVHAMDTKGVRGFMMANKDALAAAAKSYSRENYSAKKR